MARPANTRVLIIDDCPLFCLGLTYLLKLTPGYTVIGETGTIADALKIIEKEKPQLIIMEIHFGNENGMDFIPELKDKYPEIMILVLSIHDERYYSERILRLGAQGYIMKSAPVNQIKSAVNTIMSGKVYLSEEEKDRIFESLTGKKTRSIREWINSVPKLSDREIQVFSFIGKGYGTIEIAAKLNLSTKTVDVYKEHIKNKLHCNTTQELRQLAIEYLNYSDNL